MSTFLAASSSTAARASAAVVTQCGAIVRPGSGPVMPRPAVKKRAAPGIFPSRVSCTDLERHVRRVLPQALRRADAVIRAPLQVVDQHLARLAEMLVRVDDRRHHGLAGEVHARRARGDAHVGGAADLREAIAADDERGVLDRSASVADDDAGAFEDGHAGRRLRQD